MTTDPVAIAIGISKEHDLFRHRLSVATRIVPAARRNKGGIVGAAMVSRQGAST
jgi:hypothetical protein